MFSDLLQDFRYGFRQLIKARGFATIAILTLAIGIGTTTAIFSIVNSVALQPMPYKDAEQLLEIRQVRLSDQRAFSPLWETIEELQKQTEVFESVTASTGMHGNLSGVDFPVRVFGHAVALNYFSTLGVQPLIGRTFLPEEVVEGNGNVIILNHTFWLTQFNGRESVLEEKILLNDEPYTIVGVMPPDFSKITGEMSSPKAFSPLVANNVVDSTRFMRECIGRLKPGATLEQAQAELDVFARRMEATDPEQWRNFNLRVEPLLDYHVGETKPTLYLLLGAVGFLLLIACVNVANLLLVRASSRQREVAVRSALGANRRRIVRQLLAESVLLATAGGVCGILLAYVSMNTLLTFAPVNLPRLNEVRIDGFALLFSCTVTMLTGIGFGLVPALQASKVNLTLAMKEGGRSSGDGNQSAKLRNSLVVAEVALALVLLIGAGLLTRTFANLQNVDLGYDGDTVHLTRIMLLNAQYPDDQSRINFTDRALEQLAQEPEIVAAAFSTGAPYFGFIGGALDIEARTETDNSRLSQVALSTITPDYFKVMNAPLLSGRTFTERDRADSPLVAIIGENVAQQHFPDEDPIGQRIALVRGDGPRVWREIVGVVGNIHLSGPAQEAEAGIYTPWSQYRTFSHPKIIVRSRPGSPNPGRITAAALQKVDAAIPVETPMPSLGIFDGHMVAPQRYTLFLFGIFSAFALLLAALGIYGVMSYNVNQRTNEIGIRMALGAQRTDILRPIMTQGGRLVLIGLILGIGGALAGTKLLASMLYDTSPSDPLTFVIISIVLALTAALACYLPARRATKVDPLVALRTE